MKTKKKISTNKDNLDTIISKGKAEVEKKRTKRPKGRPKNKSAKIQCLFYFEQAGLLRQWWRLQPDCDI